MTLSRCCCCASLQACRGDGLDDGVEVDSAGETSDCSFSQNLCVPVDTAVMYATAPGKQININLIICFI